MFKDKQIVKYVIKLSDFAKTDVEERILVSGLLRDIQIKEYYKKSYKATY